MPRLDEFADQTEGPGEELSEMTELVALGLGQVRAAMGREVASTSRPHSGYLRLAARPGADQSRLPMLSSATIYAIAKGRPSLSECGSA